MLGNILLVDDDRDFRTEIREALEEYEVLMASSGEEALEILEKPNVVELVILDLKLPGISGTQALEKIKKAAPEVKIYMLTGYSTKESAIKALRLHADDYIEKPVDLMRLRALVRDALGENIEPEEVSGTDINGKIEKVKLFIEKNVHKRIRLKDAADAVFVSPKYLSRIFKETTGIGFSQYRLNKKIEASKELLVETGYNISQIAYKMGFNNPESFMRMFKKITGRTPTQYRKKARREKEEAHATPDR